MRDILKLVSQLHYISTKDQTIFDEIKEIVANVAKRLESGVDYEENSKVN